jgi:hypothetical protein
MADCRIDNVGQLIICLASASISVALVLIKQIVPIASQIVCS